MNRRYFLRGFGVGVLFSVLVLGIACAYRTSDRQTIDRAMQLGMTFSEEDDELTFAGTKPAITATEKPEEEIEQSADNDGASKEATGDVDTAENDTAEDGTSENNALEDDTAGNDTAEDDTAKDDTAENDVTGNDIEKETGEDTGKSEQSQKKEKSSKKKEKKEVSSQDNFVSVQITRGMWSDSVAVEMENKGLVDNAEKFDKYLNNHGYASFISVGTFKIPEGASYEQIARIITNRE